MQPPRQGVVKVPNYWKIRSPIPMKVLAAGVIVLWMGFVGWKAREKLIYTWFPAYIQWELGRLIPAAGAPSGPTHVLFMVADHFEPGSGMDILHDERRRYPELVRGHFDSEGRPPQNTWFYPVERIHGRETQLEVLAELAREGYGEIEIHMHHGYDTSESFRAKLREGKAAFRRVGFGITTEGQEAFAYVAGNWGLDNGAGARYSGVNDELTILREEGAFADFTFPALDSPAQPKSINTIYYAVDDPANPKSYEHGSPVSVGLYPARESLLLVTGPLFVNWRDWRHIFYPAIESGGVQAGNPPSEFRVDSWVRARIHVAGKPNWVFIKVHTHGANLVDRPVVRGKTMEQLFSYFETKYNDGENYVLHYVTAREMYNIIKAAEAGCWGNPGGYRNFVIRPYQAHKYLSPHSKTAGLQCTFTPRS